MAALIELEGVAPTMVEDVWLAPDMLGAGIPAREKERLDGAAAQWTPTSAREYQRLVQRYQRPMTTRGV